MNEKKLMDEMRMLAIAGAPPSRIIRHVCRLTSEPEKQRVFVVAFFSRAFYLLEEDMVGVMRWHGFPEGDQSDKDVDEEFGEAILAHRDQWHDG